MRVVPASLDVFNYSFVSQPPVNVLTIIGQHFCEGCCPTSTTQDTNLHASNLAQNKQPLSPVKIMEMETGRRYATSENDAMCFVVKQAACCTFTPMYYTNILPSKVQLSSGSSTIDIWPMEGAIVNSWTFVNQGNPVQVIAGYNDMNDFARHAESKGFRSCKLSPYVCRLNKGHYSYAGRDYEIGKFKLNGSSIHGLLYDVPFEVISHDTTDSLAMVVLKHSYLGSDSGYPFPYDLVVTYTLSQQNRLTITSEVTNRYSLAIPIADGWHPYFQLNAKIDELHFQMASDTMLEFNEELLPTGKLLDDQRFTHGALIGNTQLDNCFLLNRGAEDPACILTNQAAGLQLRIFAHENYPYLQLYIPPQRTSIAIENLSAAPDAFNNSMGLIVLEPGETISFSASYEVGML